MVTFLDPLLQAMDCTVYPRLRVMIATLFLQACGIWTQWTTIWKSQTRGQSIANVFRDNGSRIGTVGLGYSNQYFPKNNQHSRSDVLDQKYKHLQLVLIFISNE